MSCQFLLPDPGIEPGSPALQTDSLPSEPTGKPTMLPWPLPTKTACGHWVIVGEWREKRRVQRTYEKIGRVKGQWTTRGGGGISAKNYQELHYLMFNWVFLLNSLRAWALAQLCPILCDPMHYIAHQVFLPRNFPGKNTGMSYHFLLQNILQLSTKPLFKSISHVSHMSVSVHGR